MFVLKAFSLALVFACLALSVTYDQAKQKQNVRKEVPKEARMIQGLRLVMYHVGDMQKAKEWYTKVLGLEWVNISGYKKMSELTVLVLTNGNFDLHFYPHDEKDGDISLGEIHFSLEIPDWDGWLAHLESLGIEYREVRERPQNKSKTSEIRDPDGHRVEFVYHGELHE